MHLPRIAGTVLAAVLLSVPLAAPPASTAQPEPSSEQASARGKDPNVFWRTKSKGQLDGGQRYLPRVKMCARWTYRASWTVRVAVDKNQKIWGFKDPKMKKPVLQVKFYKNCKTGAPRRKASQVVAQSRVSAANFTIRLCSWNPSVAIGYPWQISAGVAPTCEGDQDRVSRTRTLEPDRAYHKFDVSSTGTAATWKKFEYWHDAPGDRSLQACFKLRVYLDISTPQGNRAQDATMAPVTDRFCLPVGSWAMAMAGRD